MKRPSFQFYPADWRGNSKLRRCSEAARGAWLDIMCILHDSDEYGIVRWPLVELVRAAGVSIKSARELVAKQVLKGSDRKVKEFTFTPTHAGQKGTPVVLIKANNGPCWYCSRFVEDEYIRSRRGGSTRFTPSNQPEKETERARLRRLVLEKTGGKCVHCKTPLNGVWEIDHLIPRSKGGPNVFSNLFPSCVPCNQDKSDSMPDDWKSPSPTRPVGDGSGDGPTSSYSSSSSCTDKAYSTKGNGTTKPTKLSKSEKELADRIETALNSEWVNDAGKWVNRIKKEFAKSTRVVAELESAITEDRVTTTPARYAEQIWKEFK